MVKVMTIGPPKDAREILFLPTFEDGLLTIALAVGCFIVAYHIWLNHKGVWAYRFFLLLSVIGLITTPWFGTLTDSVIGAYPTIDKEGSLFFFNQGVHTNWLLHPDTALDNKGLQLIGVHIGHLWLVEIWSWFVSPITAFNIQAMANLILNCLAAWWWLEDNENNSPEWIGLLTALTLGAQLHVFRDIHWYTIEKSMLFPIFLYWGALNRMEFDAQIRRWIPILYTLAILLNFYWGILLGLLTILQVCMRRSLRQVKLFWPIALAGCIGIALGLLQMTLQSDTRRFADAAAFLTRASLDTFDISNLNWNRMGFWKPINVPICIYFGWLMSTKRISIRPILIGTIFLVLSIGPMLTTTLPNPLYNSLSIIPGMWRFAKPEIFFFITYAIIIKTVYKSETSTHYKPLFWWVVAICYLTGLYSSSAFPYQSLYVP